MTEVRASPSLSARFFRWHRCLGYLVALQVLAWVLGGALFAWLPFQAWVKSAESVSKPSLSLPVDWAQALARSPLAGQPVTALSAVATASGPAFKLRTAQGEQWLLATGGPLPAPKADDIGRFATSLYKGQGQLQAVERLAQVPTQWLMVRELGVKRDVWVARFNDALHTRLYFSGAQGEFITARSDAWVLYDFFWRLHVMDYSEGEDFNHPLIKGASLLALGLVLTGLVMLGLALRRAWRRRAP